MPMEAASVGRPGGGWIQLWNLLQEYVLNTFYAEGRLKNERA